MSEGGHDGAVAGGLRERVAGRSVLVCVGPGGVGKTTVSAALALALAHDGRRVLVVTIDPARRLATSLGLATLPNEPVPVRVEDVAGFRVSGGLDAMMLDMKRTWDGVIRRYAPSEEKLTRILANPFYQYLSTAFSGSQEYSAVEKLFELTEDGRYDVIVLDTPPTTQALDFLAAPDRLINVLDSNAVRFLTMPFKASRRFFSIADNVVFKRLAAITGTEMLKALSEFLIAFEGMYEGFARRSEEVKLMLRSAATQFLVVTASRHRVRDETRHLVERLHAFEMPMGAYIVNRVTLPGSLPFASSGSPLLVPPAESLDRLAAHFSSERLRDVAAVEAAHGVLDREFGARFRAAAESEYGRRLQLAARDEARLAALAAMPIHDRIVSRAGAHPGLYCLPEYAEPVHDVERLVRLAKDLWRTPNRMEGLRAHATTREGDEQHETLTAHG